MSLCQLLLKIKYNEYISSSTLFIKGRNKDSEQASVYSNIEFIIKYLLQRKL